MKRLLLSGALSCLIIGTVLLRFPVPQSSAETVLESAALEIRTDTAEAESRFDTGFWIGLGAVALGGVVALIIVKKKRMMKRTDETNLCLCRARRKRKS